MDSFDFNIIKNEFDNLLTAAENKLEREWPSKYQDDLVNGGKFTIQSFYRMSIVNYGSVVALCNLSQEQSLNLYLSTPSLNRSLIENVFTVVFLLEDFYENNKLFIRNSLREKAEMLEFYRNHYAGIPKWDEFIVLEAGRVKNYQNYVEGAVGLSEEEKNNLENMKRLPRVSGIVKYLAMRNHQDIRFFLYLEGLHYVQLSHLAHSQPTGLIATGTILNKSDKSKFESFVTDQQWIAITLILSLISELEIHFEFGLGQKIAYIWGIAKDFSDYTGEAYTLRYQSLLK